MMDEKVVSKPKETLAPRPATVVLQEFLDKSGIVISIVPQTKIRVVSDGSIIVDPPTLSIRYKNGQN